ncbi:hypothetical protein VTK26DRAFT_3931 [Humicola hyalothermophila]
MSPACPRRTPSCLGSPRHNGLGLPFCSLCQVTRAESHHRAAPKRDGALPLLDRCSHDVRPHTLCCSVLYLLITSVRCWDHTRISGLLHAINQPLTASYKSLPLLLPGLNLLGCADELRDSHKYLAQN